MLETLKFRSGLEKDAPWRSFIFQWMTLSFILHIIAAVKSSGFFHVDEHFQIAEFVNAKLGRSPLTELPLEFRELIRPWLLPAIYTGLTHLLNSIGITNPFDWALSYRIFAALLGWVSTLGAGLCCYLWFPIKKWRNLAVMAMTLLWYMPAFHARHSSENLGGSAFLMGLTLLLLGSPPRKKPSQHPGEVPFSVALTSGLLLGLAFEFRYQVGVMIVGFFFWLVIIARVSLLRLLPLIAGILIAVGLGTLADFWGYGKWTFAPWNYLQFNLIQNHFAEGDPSPAWDYFRRAFTESWPLIGLLTLLSFPIAWIRNPKHCLTWSFVPFFLVHLWISHKELRFLFPMIHVGGVLLVLAISPLQRTPHWAKFLEAKDSPLWQSGWIRWPIRSLIGLNFIGLVALTTLPAWMPIQFYQRLYRFKPFGFQVYYKDDQLINLGGAILNFYRPSGLPLVRIGDYSELTQALEEKETSLWLYTPYRQLPEEAGILTKWCKVEFSTWPVWLEGGIEKLKFSTVTREMVSRLTSRMTNWTLYRCKSPSLLKKALETAKF